MKTYIVFTCKNRQSNRRLLNQLDGFHQDVISGNTANERQGSIRLNEGTGDRDFTVGTSGYNIVTDETTVKATTLDRCFNEKIAWEISNFVDTVEDRIQNAVLTDIDTIVAPKIELAIRSINASSGQDATSATGNSERGENIGITATFENASENNNVILYQMRIVTEETIFRTI